MNAQAQQVIPAEPPNLPAPISLLDVISRAASDPSVDIDKMERLMQMHERIVLRDAEAAFNNAIASCQAESSRIAADAYNGQTKSNYATYAKLDKVLRPIYTRHGLSISYDTGDAPREDFVRVLAHVSKGGFTRTYRIDMPADGKGAKGGDVMTKTHATGAAMQYGMRYLLKAIFNVAIGDEDKDGNDPAAGMPDDDIAEWIKKIEATTTKDKAKEVWAEAVKVAKEHKDNYAAKKLKESLIAHGEFIDGAAK